MSRNIYALLVGINEYPDPRHRLYGCLNDIAAIQEYLEHRISDQDFSLHLETLVNNQATRQAVIDKFRGHLGQAGPNDVAFFYFSGHGSQETAPPEFWPVEADRLNETLVCWDSRQGSWDLADKELAKLIAEVAKNKPHIVVILDACHSGSGSRDPLQQAAIRHIPTDQRQRQLSEYIFSPEELKTLQPSLDRTEHPSGWLTLPEGSHILLAACRDSETAKEYNADGKTWGSFSYFLRTTLERANGSLTYLDLFKQVRALVRNNITAQTPQLEATQIGDFEQPFLGGAIAPRTTPYFTVSYDRDLGSWVVDGGAVHGLLQSSGREMTLLSLFAENATPQEMRQLSNTLGYAQVEQVLPHVSRVVLKEVDNLDENRSFKGVVTSLPMPPLGVQVEGDEVGIRLIREALITIGLNNAPSLYVQEVTATPQLRLLAQEGEYLVTRPSDSQPLVAQIKDYTLENARIAVRRLEHIARWINIVKLNNVGSSIPTNAVKLTLSYDGSDTDETNVLLEYTYQNGKWEQPEYYLTLENQHNEPLYCTVLHLSENFQVEASYFPSGGIWLKPREKQSTKSKYALVPKELWRIGITERKDILKVIVCTAEFDPTLLQQDKLDALRVKTRSVEDEARIRKNTLNRLMNRLQLREAGDKPEGEEYGDWVTSQMTLMIRRPREVTPIPTSGTEISLGAGVTLSGHAELMAKVRLGTMPQADRDLGSMMIPSILREDAQVSQTFYFSTSRGGDPGLSMLELSEVNDYELVTPDAPLKLTINAALAEGEHLLPFGFDGEFFLPLGHIEAKDNQLAVTLDRLPAPVALGQRDFTGSIRILFQKLISKPLGLEFPYPILAAVDIGPDGQVIYDADPDRVAARVARANHIVLYVHGIIGDTRGMAASAQIHGVGDLILTFDYENINTPIELIAVGLKERLTRVGLEPNHGKTLQIVAHSMGGLVSRWFIEKEGGNKVIQHLIMLGTPNGGSPWPTVQGWVTMAVALTLNSLSVVAWPITVLGGLVALIEKVDVTLDQMQPGSPTLALLYASDDPGVPYTLIAGNTLLVSDRLKQEAEQETSQLRKLLKRLSLKKLAYGLTSMAPFFGQPNDIAVSISEMKHIKPNRSHELEVWLVACDHMSYFSSEVGVGLGKLTEVLKRFN